MSPQVAIPAVAAGVAGGVAAGTVFSFSAFATTLALSGVSYAINKASAKSPTDPSLSQTVKEPAGTRQVIYGERRVGGKLVYIGQSDNDKYVHLVIALAGHEVESISDIWLNDNPVSTYGNYGKKPSATVTWDEYFYSGGGDFNSLSVTVNGITHTGSISSISTDLSARGFIVTGEAGSYEVSAGHEDSEFRDFAVLEITVDNIEDILTVTSVNGTVSTNAGKEFPVIVNTHLGTADQAADSDMVSQLSEWTSAHRLRGIAYVYVRLRYEFEAFPSGIPTVTALVQGKNDIYDPRTGTTGYTKNAALCVADYIASDKWGYGAEYGTEIDNAALIAAANICDEPVALNGGGYESRYECSGVVDSGNEPKQNIEALLSSMAGKAVYTGGYWTIKAGAYEVPTVSLNESDLRGALSIQTKLSRTEICNRVKGVYVSPENDYQPADFPVVTNATYLAEDNNEKIWKDLDLGYTTSSGAAQRIAKIILEESRQGITVKVPCKLSAFNLIASDTVMFSNTRMGWTNKVFRVVDWEFSVDDSGALGVDLILRETASGVYDWNSGEETTVDLAPNTSLPSPWYVAPVSSLTFTETTEWNADGAIVPKLTVSWGASTSSIWHYKVTLREAMTDNFLMEITTRELSHDFYGLRAGIVYRANVVAVNRFGNESVMRFKISALKGLPDPPTAPDSATVTGIVGGLKFVWSNTSQENTLLGTQIYTSTTNDRATAVKLNTVPGETYQYPFDAGTPVYVWFRAIDRVGMVSGFYPLSATGGLSATPLDAAQGPAGEDGQGIVKGLSFLRAASQPATPSGGSFSSPTATGWSDGVPAGTNPLYMTTRIFTSDGQPPQQAGWTTPQRVSQLGQGTKAQFSVDGSTNWHDTPTTNDEYMRTGVSNDGGATWTYGGAVRIKGETGDAGESGADGQAVNMIFRRSATQPATPANSSGVPNGWYDETGSVPSGSDPVWSCIGTRASTTSNWVWQTPVKIVVEGDLANKDQVDTPDIVDNAVTVTGVDETLSNITTSTTAQGVVSVQAPVGCYKVILSFSCRVIVPSGGTVSFSLYKNGIFHRNLGVRVYSNSPTVTDSFSISVTETVGVNDSDVWAIYAVTLYSPNSTIQSGATLFLDGVAK